MRDGGEIFVREVRAVIAREFRGSPPWRAWSSKNLQPRGSASAEMKDPAELSSDLLRTLGSSRTRDGIVTFGLEADWTGQAWAVCWRESEAAYYSVMGSRLLPLVALRPASQLDIGDGLDEHWPMPARIAETRLDTLQKLLGPACQRHGRHLVRFDASAIQQKIRYGWFGQRKAWDYLFYVGVPTA
jgi:hypothetical protein